MGFTIRAGDAATCGHLATGSLNVLINGRGAARVGLDTAGGVIIGPGVLTVLVNGLPISIEGDSILPHEEPPHDAYFLYLRLRYLRQIRSLPNTGRSRLGATNRILKPTAFCLSKNSRGPVAVLV